MAKLEPLGWRHAPDIQRAVKGPGMRECSQLIFEFPDCE